MTTSRSLLDTNNLNDARQEGARPREEARRGGARGGGREGGTHTGAGGGGGEHDRDDVSDFEAGAEEY